MHTRAWRHAPPNAYPLWYLDHTLSVAVLDALDELPDVETGGHLVEAGVGHNLVKQLPAGNELQDDEDLCAGGEHLVQLDDVLVLDHLHDRDLLLDLRTHVLLLNLLLVKDLDGDLLACLCIDSKLDLQLKEDRRWGRRFRRGETTSGHSS